MSVQDETSGVSYSSLSAAIAGSSANDTLLLSAGAYVENFPNITHSLTMVAVGGLASLTTPQPIPVNDRAILNVPFDAGVDLSISGLEISGARREEPYPNGAGILFEIGNGILTVTNSYIHDNEDGILTGYPDAASPGGTMSVTISHSQISGNGAPPGSSYASSGSDHNIYAGTLTAFTLVDSYVSNEQGNGHEVKSRALSNIITGNRIQDGPSALASYVIDLPDGGNDVVSNNIIEKGPLSANRYIVHFGGEGTYPGSSLILSGNTIINDRASGATGLYNQTRDPNSADPNYNATIPATIAGNTFYGVDQSNLFQDAYGPPLDLLSNNVVLSGAAPSVDTSPGFPAARVLVWTGALGTAFQLAANWNDVTNGLTPAQVMPDAFDTVEFNSVVGGISGTGTVGSVAVGAGGNGVLDVVGGTTLVAGSLSAGVAIGDVGQIGLTGTGTALILTDNAIVADVGTGVMSVLNGATFSAQNLTIGNSGNSLELCRSPAPLPGQTCGSRAP